LALLGVAFYVLLLPWHFSSQLEQQLLAAEFGLSAEAICSSGGNAGPSVPGAPAPSCPICKGLAAFQLAVAPAAQFVSPPLPMRAPAIVALREDVAGAVAPAARSRGPPSQA